MIIYTILLFLINIVYKGWKISKSPNSMMLEEIDLLRSFHYFSPLGDYSIRYIPVILSALISVISFYFVYRLTKKIWLAMAIGLVLVISPWLIILSRYFNIYVIFLLSTTVILILPVNTKIKLVIVLIMIFVFRYFFVSTQLPTLNDLTVNFTDLFKFLDFRTLFFGGDPLSPTLRIPQTGFFMYMDFIFLIAGMYFLYVKKQVPALRNYTHQLLFLGIIFFLYLSPDMLYTYRGLMLFYYISILIGCGYFYLVSIVKIQKKIIYPVLAGVIFLNIIFYLELFYNHFDKKNSSQWGYAEEAVIKYYRNINPPPVIYLSNEAAGKLNRFINYYKVGPKTQILTLNRLKEICALPGNYQCIIRESDLSFFQLKKEDIKTIFRYYDGLPMYFVIPQTNQ